MVTQTAALPVRETFVPQNIIEQANQKYPNGQIYDITAVKSAEDTMSQNSNATSWNSSNINNNMDNDHDKDDSTQAAMNQNTTNNQYQDSSMNQTNASANTYNNMNTNNENAPEKYDYVVRVLQGGQMVTEKLYSDGTALRERNPRITTTGALTSQ